MGSGCRISHTRDPYGELWAAQKMQCLNALCYNLCPPASLLLRSAARAASVAL